MTNRERKYHRWKKQEKRDFINWEFPAKRNPNDQICEDESCSHFATVRCVLWSIDEKTGYYVEHITWLCVEHADKQGFCIGCGTFIAGSEQSLMSSFCENCFDQIKEDCDDW